MINPSELNLSTLPSVRIEDKKQLPSTPCIYFAIDSQGVIQYIGKSVNPAQRWVKHHRYARLAGMDSVKIAYLTLDSELLLEVEAALIKWFDPPLNGWKDRLARSPDAKKEATDKPKVSVYLETELKDKAESAAKKDGRSLSNWIRELIRREVESQEEES